MTHLSCFQWMTTQKLGFKQVDFNIVTKFTQNNNWYCYNGELDLVPHLD